MLEGKYLKLRKWYASRGLDWVSERISFQKGWLDAGTDCIV